MVGHLLRYILILLPLLYGCQTPEKKIEVVPRAHPGAAIIGNGEVCIVYSDDQRIFNHDLPVAGGILQYYFNDFTHSYIRGSAIDFLSDTGSISMKQDTFGLDPFFSPFLKKQSDKISVRTQIFVTENGITTQRITVRTAVDMSMFVRWSLYAPSRIGAEGAPSRTASHILKDGLYLRYSNDVIIAITADGESSQYTADEESGIITVTTPLHVPASRDTSISFYIASGWSDMDVITRLFTIDDTDLFADARTYWNHWIERARMPIFSHQRYRHSFEANLYALRAASLQGAIPSRIPHPSGEHTEVQLRPHDALMTARVFLASGYPKLAAEVISYWFGDTVTKESAGHWYTRYYASGKPVHNNGGNTIALDVTAYITILQSMLAEHGIADLPRDRIFNLLDVLIERVDERGLLQDGGIVERFGYLPSTNMAAIVALRAGASLAAVQGEPGRARRYTEVSRKIEASLPLLFDPERQTYTDYLPGLDDDMRSWNTSTNFGILWGYPNHPEIAQSNDFYLNHCLSPEGGMQFYQSTRGQGGKDGYHLYFTTTGAAAQYHAQYGTRVISEKMIVWMISNSNSYGLMPEYLSADGTIISQESPHAWSMAEFLQSLLSLSKTLPI